MKTMKIIRLVLENFKCHKALTVDFGGDNARIYGDNATGKSSIYDAVLWLMFGKDSRGSANFDVLPLNRDGEVEDHEAIASVTALLDIDGTNIELKRTLREKWVTRRGSSSLVYDGNETGYAIDGVPMKKNEYDRRIAEIIPEDIFRLLTSVTYFASDLRWQDRRKALLALTSIPGDAELMGEDDRFAPLAEAMGGQSLEDFARLIAAQKKALTGTRNETPARIDELKKTKDQFASYDFPAIEAEIGRLEDMRNAAQQQYTADLAEYNRVNNEAMKANHAEELEIRQRMTELERLNTEHRRGTDNTAEISAAMAQKRALERSLTSAKNHASMLVKQIPVLEQQIETYRKEWAKVNAETFSGGSCPTCGQSLPAEQLAAAQARFEGGKAERLNKLVSIAKTQKNVLEESEARLTEAQADVTELEDHIAAIVIPEPMGEAADLPEYADRMAELKAKLVEIINREMPKPTIRHEDYEARMAELRKDIDELKEQLSKRSVIEQCDARMKELRELQRATAEELERIEKLQVLMEEFTRHKVRYIDESVNHLFLLARFRLFREQANGGLEERCDVTYDGVPYASINSGMRINLGIDIIRTLSAYYGYSVPLVVDNAESVTKLEKLPGQMIELIVDGNERNIRVEVG